jgi:glutamate dehydrogenase/leucine dehydrogenase/CBS domain-containing protein
MIPQQMDSFLRERLPERTFKNRLIRQGNLCYMEFGPLDVDHLLRLGIVVDNLGPRLVSCMWDAESNLEIGGFLVVDNLAMGKPAMGGIRMLPDVTPGAIHNLARGMTLKNAAANLPYGGGKSGIVAPPVLPSGQHKQIIRGFAQLIHRYHDIYLPGPDVGTNDDDMKTIAIENGMDNALSKPVDMGGNRIDQLGAAAGGVIIALEALLEEMPRLVSLSQFANLEIPSPDRLTILIQGFGAVGAHAARILDEKIPGARVIGISDKLGYLYDEEGLPIETLYKMWLDNSLVTRLYFQEHHLSESEYDVQIKYSTAADDLLRESAFCLIPAAPVSNYLDTDPTTDPSMVVDHMGNWTVIIEGANTYSPDPARKTARARMERAVYRERGVLIATDYLVNSGGVIFAAQEHLIKTPQHLRIPEEMLGDDRSVEEWLDKHASQLNLLAEKRRYAAESYRDEVIRRNMRELVDLLITDADMLPCEAAELISIRRIAISESDRTAAEILAPMPTIYAQKSIRDAASMLIETGCPILAVLSTNDELVGVVTGWDITQATALGSSDQQSIKAIMTQDVIVATPEDSILEMIRKLEHYEISAMPVVDEGSVKGMVSADLLARKSLLRLLQSQIA